MEIDEDGEMIIQQSNISICDWQALEYCDYT